MKSRESVDDEVATPTDDVLVRPNSRGGDATRPHAATRLAHDRLPKSLRSTKEMRRDYDPPLTDSPATT